MPKDNKISNMFEKFAIGSGITSAASLAVSMGSLVGTVGAEILGGHHSAIQQAFETTGIGALGLGVAAGMTTLAGFAAGEVAKNFKDCMKEDPLLANVFAGAGMGSFMGLLGTVSTGALSLAGLFITQHGSALNHVFHAVTETTFPVAIGLAATMVASGIVSEAAKHYGGDDTPAPAPARKSARAHKLG